MTAHAAWLRDSLVERGEDPSDAMAALWRPPEEWELERPVRPDVTSLSPLVAVRLEQVRALFDAGHITTAQARRLLEFDLLEFE